MLRERANLLVGILALGLLLLHFETSFPDADLSPFVAANNVSLRHSPLHTLMGEVAATNVSGFQRPAEAAVKPVGYEFTCSRGLGSFNKTLFWPMLARSDAMLYDVIGKGDKVFAYFNTHAWACARPRCGYVDGRFAANGVPTSWSCVFPHAQNETVVPAQFGHDPHQHGFRLICTVPDNTILSDQFAHNISFLMARDGGGQLRYDSVPFCAYPKSLAVPQPRHAVALGACVMVTTRVVPPRQILEWVVYHKLQGFDHIYIFPEESPCYLAEILQPFIAEGFVELVDFWWPVHGGGRNIAATMNMCLARYRGMARWVGFFDVDEFFQPMQANRTVRGLVLEAESTGVQALQVSSIFYEWVDDGLFVENSRRRAAHPPGDGRQKCIVRPEHVDFMGNHVVTLGAPMVVPDHMKTLRLDHYRRVDPAEGFYPVIDVADTSMSVYGPPVAEELSRLFPAWEEAFRGRYHFPRAGGSVFSNSSCPMIPGD